MPITILLVDDEKKPRESTRYLLEGMMQDATILEARDYIEATQTLRNNNNIHLVITDYHMQPKDGQDLINEVRRNHPDTPCILISTSENTQFVADFLRVPFAKKPLEPEIIQGLINDCTQKENS